ncbi:hypothetical protein N0V90_007998 [Kalmusia sp. IMI 367209]|nr:hypothetical protein N0V90_007998 [Kalmusia sp. IMI 367209]
MSPSPTQQAQLQQHAYNAINEYFTRHSHEVVEIEILPPALEPLEGLLLEDGANLGLPKKILALAFVRARHLFFENRHSELPKERELALEATRVMLLFDPEHLTAANYRKHHLLNLKGEDGVGFTSALLTELCFLDSILTSPLHRQSKSPILWSHRFWTLPYLIPSLHQSASDLTGFFKSELEAVCKSGERHPKNYYAWQYARRVLSNVPLLQTADERDIFFDWCVTRVKDWCCQHPSDISGWMFLAWSLPLRDTKGTGKIVRQIVEYAVSVRLANDSLWVFVRTVIANGTIRKAQAKEVVAIMLEYTDGKEHTGPTSPFHQQISKSLEWMEMNTRGGDFP